MLSKECIHASKWSASSDSQSNISTEYNLRSRRTLDQLHDQHRRGSFILLQAKRSVQRLCQGRQLGERTRFSLLQGHVHHSQRH